MKILIDTGAKVSVCGMKQAKPLIVIIVKIVAGEMLLTLSPAMNIQIMMRLNNRQLISELPPSEGQHDYEDPTLNTLTMTLGLSSELP